MTFDENLKRVQDLTGLDSRDAARVAFEFGDDETPSAAQIVEKARALGFDIERKHATRTRPQPTLGPEIEMDAARVLSEVYLCSPRCLPVRPGGDRVEMPKIGRAPTELQELGPELLEGLPEEIRVLLLKIDLYEAKATLWLWDEANMIDRPVGPIDLARYETPGEMIEAIVNALLPRLTRVLAADWN